MDKRMPPANRQQFLRWTFILVIGLYAAKIEASARPANFGHQWIRSNPFTIMGAALGVTPAFNIDRYQNMNLNTVFANQIFSVAEAAADAGVSWHMHFAPGSRPYVAYNDGHKLLINQVIARGHATAWMLQDEPSSETEYQNVAQSNQWMQEAHPELLTYITVFQNNVSTLNHIVDTIHPDLLMFDNYPFRSNGSTDANGWFQTLMNVRQVSLSHQIPYGGWLQSFHDGGSNVRTPSESDTRYNGFTLLTSGYTMLNYFMYDHGAAGAGSTSDLLDQNGNPTALYHQAAAANLEYANVGRSLRFLSSTDVRFVPGRRILFGNVTIPNSAPSGLSNWAVGAGGDLHILSAIVDSSQPGYLGSEKNGLIGFFTGDDSQQYFMLTNLNHGGNLSAEAASLSFMITFDSSVSSIWRLNRLTGLSEEILLSNHSLFWTLPGGTGDLFKYDNGNFVGVPEPASITLIVLGILWALSCQHQRPEIKRNRS